jgi:hypothetical protein
MSILKNFVADAIEEIRGALSRTQNTAPALADHATDADGLRNFAPAHGANSGADGDAAGEAALALRSSNEEPRPGDSGLLPGTALPGPGTHCARTDPGTSPAADVFIETDHAQGILGDVDWDVLTAGDASVRILGDDGQLQHPGDRRH